MTEKYKDEGFKVSDRRLFSSEGDFRSDAVDENVSLLNSEAATAVSDAPAEVPPPPSLAEQTEQADAYRKTNLSMDILGARQTIDTLGLLADKTKGNLTPGEQNFLQNALYELRMAYLEVANAIARGPQSGAAGSVIK
jgi:hypothetical protein